MNRSLDIRQLLFPNADCPARNAGPLADQRNTPSTKHFGLHRSNKPPQAFIEYRHQRFKDLSSFLAALNPDQVQLSDFNSAALGDIADGQTVDGITFDSFTATGTNAPYSLRVDAAASPPLPGNYIGTNDTSNLGTLTDGDSLSVSFSSSTAFGLWFYENTPFSPGDDVYNLRVTTSDDDATVGNLGAGQSFGTFWRGWFVGITSDTVSFESATITSMDVTGQLSFVMDDMYTTGVPVPATAALLALGFGLIVIGRARRARG